MISESTQSISPNFSVMHPFPINIIECEIKKLPFFFQVPVMALTATATPRVRTDILFQVTLIL